uniref:Insulinase family protein n=1 Tax=Ignavibacterium album TaxID=591197 RepID=A0A832DHF0_9BACT
MTLIRTKPEIKNEIKFSLDNISTHTLKNGIKLFYLRKEKLPMIRLNLVVEAGGKFDFFTKPGTARLTSQMIDEGADGLTALELSDEFDLLGTDFSISADNDFIILSLQSLTENFEKSLELFSKVILKPDFPEKEFEREKKKLLVNILQLKDDPERIAEQIFDKIIFANHYYAMPVSGYLDTVEKVNLNDVINHYSKYFKANNSFIAAAGNLTSEEIFQLIEKYFDTYSSSSEKISLPEKFEVLDKKIFVYDKSDSVQTEIRVGYLSGKRNISDYFSKLLLNTIFGGQFNSRLNSNLREKKGYTYGISSHFVYNKNAGYFSISTSVSSEITFDAVKEILSEIKNLKNGVTEEELNFAKTALTRKFPLNFENYRQLTSNLSALAIHNLPLSYFNEYLRNLNSVTIVQVNEQALKLSQADMKIILVGNRKSFEKEFTEKGFELVKVDERGDLV